MTDLPLLAKEYAPYDTLPEFALGYAAYGTSAMCPFDGPQFKGYQAQAWDRGLECAMRVQRWIDRNVGAN
jgi:hypothetical protein